MLNNNTAINRVFTHKVIFDLLNKGKNDVFDYVVSQYIQEPESKTHREIMSEMYSILGKENRNEYYYQNTLLNKLLSGIHSVNTTTALFQVRVDKAIADFVLINGEGKIYEIKSDLDNFSRLRNQLSSYYTAFSKVSVLVAEQELSSVKRLLSSLGEMGDAVGVYVLTNRGTIFSSARSKEPEQYNKQLSHTSIYKLMRKKEYENTLRNYFGEVPKADQVFHFRVCLDKFHEIPLLDAQNLAMKELKQRIHISKTSFDSIQKELKSIIYASDFSRYIPRLEQLLQTNYRG